MTRVIHTGDTHLGYRQYHSPERRRDFLAAFRQVIDDAIETDVDAVVHAGDLFHDRTPGLVDVHGAIEVLRDLRDADIPFLAIVGNHERTRDQQWLDLFETLGLATRLDDAPTRIGDTAFYGLDFVPRSQRDSLSYDFEPHDATHAALVSHGLFEPFPHADWDTEELLESATVDFDAMLLGDNHATDRTEIDGTWVTYCGSTERADASERDPRGYNLVTFDDGVSIRRRGLDTRTFVPLDIDLSGDEGEAYVRERIREADVEDAVVIVTLSGDGSDVSAAEIESFATERGALLARVNDRREFDAENEAEVRFADPDEAVRARLRDLGPSVAALGIDETIRSETVPDSNVRDRVTDHVESLLKSEESAFQTTAEIEPATDRDADETGQDGAQNELDEASSDETPEDSAVFSDTDSDSSGDSGPGQSDTTGTTEKPRPSSESRNQPPDAKSQQRSTEAESQNETTEATSSEPDDPTEESSESGADPSDSDGDEEPATDSTDDTEKSTADGQVTMEDYV